MPNRDPGLDTLLDLHGQTLFVDETGHWVKFIVHRTDVTTERPHGLSYSLTLHAPNGERLVGVRQRTPGQATARTGQPAPHGARPSASAADDPALRVPGRGHTS